jgi:hypothetical protein
VTTLAQTSTGKGTNAFNIAFLTQQAVKLLDPSVSLLETGVGLNLGSSVIDLVLYNLVDE